MLKSASPSLLVIDDDAAVLALVKRVAASIGFTVRAHQSGRDALTELTSAPADVALVDLRMPDLGGFDILRAIRLATPHCEVILMTGFASVDSAVEAVKLGALDYLSKPLDLVRLRQLLTNSVDEASRRVDLLAAEDALARRFEMCGMIGRSAVMQDLFSLVRRVAPHVRTALVTGETGAGKEGIARAIHELGPRRTRRFLAVNCSAIVEGLFESELFGHMRGAFTGAAENKPGLFEAADGGTLFLDEVGELPLTVQAKLLRVLETGEVQRVGSVEPRRVDVRIVAATHRNLRDDVEGRRFRGDLFYRLNVVGLHVPPLRARREDIPYLTATFVKEFAARFAKSISGVSGQAERLLMSATWPGNVRELRNCLERACMLADAPMLSERDLVLALPPPSADPMPEATPLPGTDFGSVEREHIVRVLAEQRGSKVAAARKLGISRRTLYRRLEFHNLSLT
jgi:two-component system response regulator HydG